MRQYLFNPRMPHPRMKSAHCQVFRRPQRSNAGRMRNMARFTPGKLQEKLKKTISKSQKIKPLLEIKVLSICEKVPICLPLTLSYHNLFCHCISNDVL